MTFSSKSLFALTAIILRIIGSAEGQNSDYQPHYLVGLLNYPQSDIVPIFQNVTSGTYIDNTTPLTNWLTDSSAPYSFVPHVGYSDIEFYYDSEGTKVRGEFFVLSDNGFGSSANSADFPLNIAHMKIQRPFAYGHGGSSFPPYNEAENLGSVFISDPNNYIEWENGADIQVTYDVPDESWNDLVENRVLTGRDLDPEGLAVINGTCALLGEEFMPAIMTINPSTGEILSPFVRTPDIDEDGNFIEGKFLSTVRDKMQCKLEDIENNQCMEVDEEIVDESGYRKHYRSGGYEGFSKLPDGSVAAFLEVVIDDEPGVRVYRVDPGSCRPGDPPKFESFRGYYPFELNAKNIADVSAIPGSSNLVAVIERNGFPGLGYPVGHEFPAPVMPANKVCVVDLDDVDENLVMQNKKCILNYHLISDPWDVDGNGILRSGFTQVTNEQLIVVDDYCIVAGTDTNWPWTNQLGLDVDELPYRQEVEDARFMVVCFEEPIFNPTYELMNQDGGSEEIVHQKEESQSLSVGTKTTTALAFTLLVTVLVANYFL